jgi:hypothetical protein
MAEPAPSEPPPGDQPIEQARRSRSATALGVGLIVVAGAVALVWGGISLWSLWFR